MESREIGDASPTQGIRRYRKTALTSVMLTRYACCTHVLLEEPESWNNLHVGAVDWISRHHLQVMMTDLLQQRWEWQQESYAETQQSCKANNVFGELGHNNKDLWHISWTATTHTDGWLRLCAWNVGTGMQGHVWRLNSRHQKRPLRFGIMWRKNGWGKKGILLDFDGVSAHQMWIFLWADVTKFVEETSRWDL